MIQIDRLSVSIAGKLLFQDATFTINEHDKIGLLGRNGTGKSTLFKTLMQRIIPDAGHIKQRSHLSIGYLEQHLHFQKETVLEEVCLALPEDRYWEEWKAEKMLHALGFSDEDMIEDPKTFSGGWQIKMQLAKLLLAEPDLLLLDEPTNYLDIVSIRWLKQQLLSWPRAFIIITHDRTFMDEVINHCLHIHRLKISKTRGNSQFMLEKLALDEEQYEKTRLAQEKKQQEQRAWIARFQAKASMATRVQSKVKALEKQNTMEKLSNIENLRFSFRQIPFQSKEPLVKVHNLHFGYTETHLLIKALGFQVEPQDKIGIVGRNGEGKSTLLKLLHQTLDPLKGYVKYHDKVQSGYFGQMHVSSLDETRSVFEELAASVETYHEESIRNVCGQMLFSGDDADKTIATLSGGEKSRVVLGKILLKPCNLLLLDEPTNHLDMYACDALGDALMSFAGAVLLVTHDEGMLKKVCNKLVVFKDQKVEYFRCSYEHYLEKNGWQDA